MFGLFAGIPAGFATGEAFIAVGLFLFLLLQELITIKIDEPTLDITEIECEVE